MNQALISSKGGARLLSNTAVRTDDPQTLRMVAGAIANLCGNGKLYCSMCSHSCTKNGELICIMFAELSTFMCTGGITSASCSQCIIFLNFFWTLFFVFKSNILFP